MGAEFVLCFFSAVILFVSIPISLAFGDYKSWPILLLCSLVFGLLAFRMWEEENPRKEDETTIEAENLFKELTPENREKANRFIERLARKKKARRE